MEILKFENWHRNNFLFLLKYLESNLHFLQILDKIKIKIFLKRRRPLPTKN